MEVWPVILVFLAVLAAQALLLGLWTWVVWRIYRPRRPEPARLTVVAEDGWRLALYHRAPQTRRFEEPVLLCHGLAANHRNLDFEPPWSVAQHLADAGFECFTVEWRGTGGSQKSRLGLRAGHFTVDDHVRLDAPAFLDAVLRQTGARRAFWVGHSLGGLVGYAAAQRPGGERLAGLVTLGSPAFFRYPGYMRHILRLANALSWPWVLRQRLFSIASAPFLGHVTLPLTDVVMNPKAIPAPLQRRLYAQVISSVGRGVILQFREWLTEDAFRSRDRKEDWRAGLSKLSLPLLITGGTSDKLAPPAVVQSAFDKAGSEDKTLMLFGTAQGDRFDYGHGDLIFGAAAPVEVFPRLASWLTARATKVQ